MTRFSSFEHVPSETRRILRERFASKLRSVQHRQLFHPDLDVRPDEIVLKLLADLKISNNSDWSTAEATYANASPTAGEPPNLQALVDLGWSRRIWGRAEVGRDLRMAVGQESTGGMNAFKLLLSGIHGGATKLVLPPERSLSCKNLSKRSRSLPTIHLRSLRERPNGSLPGSGRRYWHKR